MYIFNELGLYIIIFNLHSFYTLICNTNINSFLLGVMVIKKKYDKIRGKAVRRGPLRTTT